MAKPPAKPPEPLEQMLAAIDKQFGKGTIVRLGAAGPIVPVDVISTGSVALDAATGIGGLPRGRVVEIYGPEGSGKTTAALSVIARCQAAGGIAAFIDAEHALDPAYAANIGVDTDALLVSQPDSGEQGLVVADMLARSGEVAIIVIDSVAALVPQAEIDGEIGDSRPGAQARLMSQGLRVLTAHLSNSKTCCVFINQLREKIGVMFGNPETTPGGKALKFYASMRLDVRRIEAIKNGTEHVGSRLRVKVVKNKMAAPFKTAEFELLFGRGIHREAELVDLGTAYGLVQKAGAFYSLAGQTLGQGRANATAWLHEHPDQAAALEVAITKAMAGGAVPAPKPVVAGGRAPVGE